MFKALHPTLSTSISIGDYIQLQRSHSTTGPARCPACEQALSIRGNLSPSASVLEHFTHVRDQNAPPCPIKSEGAIRYEVLTDTLPDTQRAAGLRAAFFENWTYHWHQFRTYVGHADIKDFAAALRAVDEKGVWKYRHIQEHEIIVAMLATMDFKPVKNPDKKGQWLRKPWVRFWFRSGVAGLHDFWNLADGRKDLIRAEYALSAKAKMISADKFKDFKVVNVENSYLTNPLYAGVPYFVQLIMSERFPGLVAAPPPKVP
ncbi:hypothetical protein LCG56_05685 [Pseudomonas cannabina pv. alisalensis]|uniref:Uncharacterized protein n=1 Tax=Pseudomonas syringae pv. maculicola str. ES4326 TaxID=629265 RepID=A0A8T8C3Q6_PSEYM|nr:MULTISPECIES: hypothetical protein [Pseudomonas syringae group]QHE97947.1 hypothetical protein PMA4326_015945 [Pseudomonas syringae pv. maculicola str. ES4326]UBY98618.1 hypothetical protein LCG56_05685 [Pseudomonas cannabina pv. alisalensis]